VVCRQPQILRAASEPMSVQTEEEMDTESVGGSQLFANTPIIGYHARTANSLFCTLRTASNRLRAKSNNRSGASWTSPIRGNGHGHHHHVCTYMLRYVHTIYPEIRGEPLEVVISTWAPSGEAAPFWPTVGKQKSQPTQRVL
jgi:hypothetical protein